MPTIHLGVIVTPYQDYRSPKAKRTPSTITTGDVAEFLEKNYGVMQFFADHHGQEIGDLYAKSLMGAMENALVAGIDVGRSIGNPFAEAESEVEHLFKQMLSSREMDGKVPGVATQAAKDGVSHRFKNPYKKRKERPSFIDTGLYQSSFKTWSSGF